MADYQSYKKIQGDAAVIPSSLGPGQVVGLSTGVAQQFFLYHCCHHLGDNGGCCLLWTVPERTTTVRFELTGGGGTGSIGACCSNGAAGGSGAYATRTVFAHCGHFTAGSSQYTICAGGASRCSCCGRNTGYQCCGIKGCTSFVIPAGGGAGGMSNFCAEGGSWGYHRCAQNCYSCAINSQCGGICLLTTSCPGCVDDRDRSFGIKGVGGSRWNQQYCREDHRGVPGSGVGPWAGGGGNPGTNNCDMGGNYQGCCKGMPTFPGGGGHSPFNDGSCCWGGFGGGGLVVVSHWS